MWLVGVTEEDTEERVNWKCREQDEDKKELKCPKHKNIQVYKLCSNVQIGSVSKNAMQKNIETYIVSGHREFPCCHCFFFIIPTIFCYFLAIDER